MKLSKRQIATHKKALQLLEAEFLSDEVKEEFYKLYNEGADCDVTSSGAFFTPIDLAWDFAFDLALTCYRDKKKIKVIDLCAGIGVLSYCTHRRYRSTVDLEIVCVEKNPKFVEIGKKLLPEATWLCLDITDPSEMLEIGSFDYAISNPPFGVIPAMNCGSTPRYSGSEAAYKVIDIASVLANDGLFIIPPEICGFAYSGVQCYRELDNSKLRKFNKETGLDFQPGMGVDTTAYEGFKNTKIIVEIADCNFENAFEITNTEWRRFKDEEYQESLFDNCTPQLSLFA